MAPLPWYEVWEKAIAPQISTPGLRALREALRIDDPRLLQGATTSPPPLACVQDWTVDGACAIGFWAWQADGLQTVADVVQVFARVCFEADQAIGEPAACRWLLNWYDEAPRDTMRWALLEEVDRTLAGRHD